MCPPWSFRILCLFRKKQESSGPNIFRTCVREQGKGSLLMPQREREWGREKELLPWGNGDYLCDSPDVPSESHLTILTDTLTVLFKLLLLHCWEMTWKLCNRVCVCAKLASWNLNWGLSEELRWLLSLLNAGTVNNAENELLHDGASGETI